MNPETTPAAKRWTAAELRKLPAEERDAILEAAAALAKEEYRNGTQPPGRHGCDPYKQDIDPIAFALARLQVHLLWIGEHRTSFEKIRTTDPTGARKRIGLPERLDRGSVNASATINGVASGGLHHRSEAESRGGAVV